MLDDCRAADGAIAEARRRAVREFGKFVQAMRKSVATRKLPRNWVRRQAAPGDAAAAATASSSLSSLSSSSSSSSDSADAGAAATGSGSGTEPGVVFYNLNTAKTSATHPRPFRSVLSLLAIAAAAA